jgi:hypothetical protein
MGVNVHFNQETYKISKLPADFRAFVRTIISLFEDKLPLSWTLWFVDSKGNNRTIFHDLEYTELRNHQLRSTCLTVDFFIVPGKNPAIPRPSIPGQEFLQAQANHFTQDLIAEQSIFSEQAKSSSPEDDFISYQEDRCQDQTSQFDLFDPFTSTANFENFPNIWDGDSIDSRPSPIYGEQDSKDPFQGDMDVQIIHDVHEFQDAPFFSQNQREKTAYADQQVIIDQQLNEVNPRAYSQPQNEGIFTIKVLKAAHLIKKLGTQILPEDKINRTMEKLRKIESRLSPQQAKEVQAMKETMVKNFWQKRNETASGKRQNLGDQEIFEEMHKIIVRNNNANDSKDIETISTASGEYAKNDQFFVNSLASPASTSVQSEGKPVHYQVACDGCGASSISGVRYKCGTCPQFNFCEICEATMDHPHCFLKIKEPIVNLVAQKQEARDKKISEAFEVLKKMMEAIKEKNEAKCDKYLNKLFTKHAKEVGKIMSSDYEFHLDEKESIIGEWKNLKQKEEQKKQKSQQRALFVKEIYSASRQNKDTDLSRQLIDFHGFQVPQLPNIIDISS